MFYLFKSEGRDQFFIYRKRLCIIKKKKMGISRLKVAVYFNRTFAIQKNLKKKCFQALLGSMDLSNFISASCKCIHILFLPVGWEPCDYNAGS